MLGRVRGAMKAVDVDLPLFGPCLHGEGNEFAFLAGVFTEPKQPLAVLLGLVDGIRQLELPTFWQAMNPRTEPLARRYLVA